MTADIADEYRRAHTAWQAQAARRFAVNDTHVLRRRADAKSDFSALCAALLSVGDQFRNRWPGERQPQDASGRRQFGDGFSLINADGVGLFVRVHETGGGDDDAPGWTWFHATSVGLDDLVLSADLALLHDTTLEPIRTPQRLTVTLQAQRLQHEVDAVHALLARALARVGYDSDRHPHLEAVDALRQLPIWPADPDAPMRRLEFQLPAAAPVPTVAQVLALLARLYGTLDGDAALEPEPVDINGRPGLGNDFVLLRDGAHGLWINITWVDMPEQHPRGSLGLRLSSVGLRDLFIFCPRLFSCSESDPLNTLALETLVGFSVTGTVPASRLQAAVDLITTAWSSLGYALAEDVETCCGLHPGG